MSQLLLDLAPEAPPSFGNFVTGHNAEACAQLIRVTAATGFHAIYLWGPSGSGKSHLLAACASPAGANRSVEYYAHGQLKPPEALTPRSLLIIDAVHTLNDDDQTTLFRLFNLARHEAHVLILAGDVPPIELGLREDLRTRIGQSLVLQLYPLSDDEKRAALRQHSLQRGMRLDDGLINYLMHHGRRDLPSLLRMIEQLDHASLEQKRQPTLPLLRELMQTPLKLTP